MTYLPESPDTTARAKEVQRDILRGMSVEKKITIMSDMCDMQRDLMAAGVRQRHPKYTDDMVRLAVIRLLLGPELFEKVYGDCGIVFD